MFYFFRKMMLKSGIYRSLIDAAIEPEIANEFVYGVRIEPFYKGIDKLTKGLSNQHRSIIGSIIMSNSAVKQAGKRSESELNNKRLYDMAMARSYLEQAFYLMLKDANPNWKPLAKSYVSSMAHFCIDEKLTIQEHLDAEEGLNPIHLILDEYIIEQVQNKKDGQDFLAGRKAVN